MSFSKEMITSCEGYCATCQQVHQLKTGGGALIKARWLASQISREENLDIFSANSDPTFSTSPLWGNARGKMLGVLECENQQNEQVFLYAFSGQFQKSWHINGWCPPLFNTKDYDNININAEAEISHITKILASQPDNREELIELRKHLSQNLMKKILTLYRIKNFAGLESPITEAFLQKHKVPTGTGDCCAPKLLTKAIRTNLKPLSIAEFYYGRSNKSGTKHHLKHYSSCQNRCQNLLGYILCGLQNDN